jgi:signal transduction histidine kinase
MFGDKPAWWFAALMLLFVLHTLFELIRDRSRVRLDIFLWLLAAGTGLSLEALNLRHLEWLAVPLQFSHTYLMLRVIQHFRPVPLPVMVLGMVSFMSAWLLYPAMEGLLPAMATELLMALPYLMIGSAMAVDLWAAWAFITGALRTRGVTRRRLALAGFASLLLVIGLYAALIAGNAAWAKQVNTAFICLAVVFYFAGFATPAWLRRIWQMPELHQFLQAGAGRSMQERAEESLDRLCPAAARAVGGITASVALWHPDTMQMTLRPNPDYPDLAGELHAQTGIIADAWYQRRPLMARTAAELGPDAARLAAKVGASVVMAVPIATDHRSFGLLLVFLRSGSLFPADDLALLSLMTEQSAMALSNLALFEEQRQLTERLRQTNHDLELANRTKSEFLANMSHELRTPLNAIIGFSEVLLDENMPIDPETEQQFQENILTSGRHLLSLINDILDLSKVEAGQMELHPEDLDLTEALQGVHAVIKPLAQKKQQVLELTVDPALTTIHHDPGRFKQIMYNLLSNAVKFTPEGGRITTTARLTPEGWLEIAVTDTGIGIAPADLETIFEEFRQVDSGYARQQQGTGLGLALVRRFLVLMGGDIHVESAVGVGSTFTVHLPLYQTVPDTPHPIGGEGPLVLVVEDDAAAASLLAFHLHRAGYRVERAASAAQALEKAQRLRPDLITLDIVLPQEDGWHVLRELKANPSTRAVPVCVVSIVDDPGTSQQHGAAAHLVKPVDPQQLLETVGRLVRSA